MTEAQFWKLIDASKQSATHDIDLQIASLKRSLLSLPEQDLVAFNALYNNALEAAHHWDLWAAAYILNGGCSDDCFEYFKDWLIAQGADVYQAALRNPESLGGVATPYEVEAELFRYAAHEAYEEKFGKAPPFNAPVYALPQGEMWDEVTVDMKFPKLAALIRG